MFFRFSSALVLVVLVTLADVALERRCQALKRAVVRQRDRHEALSQLAVRLEAHKQRALRRLAEGDATGSAPSDRASRD